MWKAKIVHRGMCLALAASFLAPYGSVAADVPCTSVRNVVTSSELYGAMSAQADEDAVARESVQKLLGRSEVRRVAARAGLDLEQAQAAISVLSGEELREVVDQARRVDEALAGGDQVVITSTTAIIILLVILILVTR